MKKVLHLALALTTFLLCNGKISAQSTLILQPDRGAGKDAMIQWRTNTAYADSNYGYLPSYEAVAWTWSGAQGVVRSLLQFDLSLIPSNAIITDARLSLYNDPTCSENNGEHSSLTGSNVSALQRITTSWDENTVTWNNQPSTTNQNQVTLPQSTSIHEDYLNIDVLNILNDMLQNPSSSFGFMFQLQTEQYYRCMLFASSDHSDCNKHPKLVITYTAPPTTDFFITIKPDSSTGKDAMIQTRMNSTFADTNYGWLPSYEAVAWTWSGNSGVVRSLLDFDLSVIPSNAVVTDARLTLYNDPTSGENNGEHSSLSGSNVSVLQRITSPWIEHSVTWNNQPGTTTQNEVILPQSNSPHQDYSNINVTAIVNDMLQTPSSSYGFMLKLQTEQYYRSMIFASSDHIECNLHPKLEIHYTVPDICVTLKIHSTGEDARIDDYQPGVNFPNEIEYYSGAWTIFGTNTIWRNLFKFDLSAIPVNATIQSAGLSLHYATINTYGNALHSSLTNSNESVVQRIITPWTENSVTWNNQPSSTTQDQVILPQSTSGTQDYLNMDVKDMVIQMLPPSMNYGFMLKLTNETPYAQMLFASGDNPDDNKIPELKICYTISTGLSEQHQPLNSFIIYPNPSGSIFNIAFNDLNEFTHLEIVNYMGQKVFEQGILQSHKSPLQINFNNVSQGIYFITLSNPHNRITKKLVVD